jgi:selenium metabolism protein YedF
MRDVDVRSLACPGPVLKLRELLEAGERALRFHVADELSRSNVSRFAASRNARVEVEEAGDGTFFVTVVAGEGSASPQVGEERFLTCDVPASPGPRIVQVSSAVMGTGNEELGALLMRSFIKTQAQLERRPDAMVFYNTGVTLCCVGSPLLDDLKALEQGGVEIIACGTCLNFFGLSDQLAVGRVTDMLEIAGRLAAAGSTVRP